MVITVLPTLHHAIHRSILLNSRLVLCFTDAEILVSSPTITAHVLLLLSHLIVTIQKSDPDVIVGHEFLGISLDVLLGRMKDLRADHWSRIGRFRRTKMNLGKPGTNLKLLYGRLVCDLASDGAKVRDSSSFLLSLITVTRLSCGR